MRSDQIHRALANGINRFEICQLAAKGVRASHKTGSRFEDSINDMLDHIGSDKTHPDHLHTGVEIAMAKKMRPAA